MYPAYSSISTDLHKTKIHRYLKNVFFNQYNQVLNFYTYKIPSWSTIIMSQFNRTSFFKHTIGTVISLMYFIIANIVDLCKVALARSIYIMLLAL